MSKGNGLGAAAYISGYDLSNDFGQIDNIPLDRALLDVTGLDKSAHERIGGLYGGNALQFTGFFNDEAAQEHPVLSALPTADVIATILKGTTIGDVGWGLSGKQVNYGLTRAADGALGTQVQIMPDDDFVQAGKSLTAGKRTDSTATNGAGVDFLSGSLSFGLVAYLHVFAFTGTSVTVTIQESSDNGSGDAFAGVTGGGFTAATGITAQRIETSLTQTVERYLRAVTTGTFSNAVFAVLAKRYVAANAER